jgi:hypothetical protein
MFSCPVVGCISWQQQGNTFQINTFIGPSLLFKSHAYVVSNEGVIYNQIQDGSWQQYAELTASMKYNNDISISDSGMAIAPRVPMSHWGNVYYKSHNDINGIFTPISSESIAANFYFIGEPALILQDNRIFLIAGDGNLYVSIKTINSQWSSWFRIGDNNPPFVSIYYHDNKLYGLSLQNKKSQIYVYPLD